MDTDTETRQQRSIRFWVLKSALVADKDYELITVSLEDEEAIYGAHGHHRNFHGSLLLLNADHRRMLQAEIGTVHINSRGWFWHCRGTELPESPPFLLTDELTVQCIFDGQAQLEGNEKTSDFLEDLDFGVVPLEGQGWFGVFMPSTLQPVTKGRMIAYGEKPVSFTGTVAARWIDAGEDVQVLPER